MAEIAKASDATSVLLRSTEVQFVTAAMKIALARHSRPIRTQRRRRRGSRIALSAGSVERGVSRKEFGVANCQREAAAQTVAIRHTPFRHGDDSPGGTFQAMPRKPSPAQRLEPAPLCTSWELGVGAREAPELPGLSASRSAVSRSRLPRRRLPLEPFTDLSRSDQLTPLEGI